MRSKSSGGRLWTTADKEWLRREEDRRLEQRDPLKNLSVPMSTSALCASSRRLRERSLPPPPPIFELPPVRPKLIRIRKKGKQPMTVDKNVFPTEENQRNPVDYYKRYIKSIYEREPLFHTYISSIPKNELNLYNSDCIRRIKSEFHDMISDKWTRKGCDDPSVEHDIAGKLYPWRNVLVRDPVCASERLFQLHTERRKLQPAEIVPKKLYVYHRSTWKL